MNIKLLAGLGLVALLSSADVINGSLFRSIRAGDMSEVQNLLRQGADLNARDEHGATPLMYAAQYSTAECMKLLLDKGANPNAKNKFGATALIWGAHDAAKVRILIASGVDVNAQANSGRTALMSAAATVGAADAVKELLAAGADVKARDSMNRGAIAAAADAGDVAILRQLLAKGGDPNESAQFGSALINVSLRGNVEAVKMLIAYGADVNFKSAHNPPVKAGVQDMGELTALMTAASCGHSEEVNILLNAGASVNVSDMRGMTPLLLAVTAESQNVETVRVLLAKGADVNAKDHNDRTALAWASLWGETPIVKLLRGAGVKGDEASVMAVGRPAANPGSPPPIREAVEKSVALLQASGALFFTKSGCGACHHQYLTGMLVAEAREKGLRVNEKLSADAIKQVMTVRAAETEPLLQHRGVVVTNTALLASLADQHYAPDEVTDALVHHIIGLQQENGWWPFLVNRPPMTSPVTETARAIRALQVYGPEGRRAEIAPRIERARAWLLAFSPQVTEERTMQLLGLHWSGLDPADLKELSRGLISIQRDDGGWGQRPGFASDAYATGQALYALNKASALATSDPVCRRGIEFLRRTQLEDGSWYVKSRAVKFQPYFESGFPHGHDQWISAAGTAWAAAALAVNLPNPPASRAAR
ncbi:MAG: ankyrin repeat domain-containing protein [Bryobacteraceae bacterium]